MAALLRVGLAGLAFVGCALGQQCFLSTPPLAEISVQDNSLLSTVSVPTRDYVLSLEVLPTSVVQGTLDTSIVTLVDTGNGLLSQVPSLRFLASSLR